MKPCTIAINPDDYTGRGHEPGSDSSSSRWARYLTEAGHQIRWVDVKRPSIVRDVVGCQGFMWRWGNLRGMERIARRLLPALEYQAGLVMYPDQATCWHYDDKIAQFYALEAAGIPSPVTWVWFDCAAALAWAKTAPYPLVLKLASGSGSVNVRLIPDAKDAREWIYRLFSGVAISLDKREHRYSTWQSRIRAAARAIVKGTKDIVPDRGYPVHVGYTLFQEFLPGNQFDTRVTVIGERAFAFRRLNRPGDFRASGSGRIEYDPGAIDQRFVRLAFQAAEALRTQSVAIDGLYRDGQCVVVEASYTYISWAIHQCPGHWVLRGDKERGQLEWVAGQMWPERAQIDDYLLRLDAHSR